MSDIPVCLTTREVYNQCPLQVQPMPLRNKVRNTIKSMMSGFLGVVEESGAGPDMWLRERQSKLLTK